MGRRNARFGRQDTRVQGQALFFETKARDACQVGGDRQDTKHRGVQQNRRDSDHGDAHQAIVRTKNRAEEPR